MKVDRIVNTVCLFALALIANMNYDVISTVLNALSVYCIILIIFLTSRPETYTVGKSNYWDLSIYFLSIILSIIILFFFFLILSLFYSFSLSLRTNKKNALPIPLLISP